MFELYKITHYISQNAFASSTCKDEFMKEKLD